MDEMHLLLQRYWGYRSFRPLQKEIAQSVISNNDNLVVFPTGSGKSLCYQLPALVMKGTCLVVSPLVALMIDQVNDLQKRGIPAVSLYGGLSYSQISNYL